MKFGKEDIGVFVSGATLFSPTEQTFAVLDFAISQGFEIDENELAHTKLDFQTEDGLSYDALEDLDYALEDALNYLNTHCVGQGVVFTFVDTDFVLLDSNYESMVG